MIELLRDGPVGTAARRTPQPCCSDSRPHRSRLDEGGGDTLGRDGLISPLAASGHVQDSLVVSQAPGARGWNRRDFAPGGSHLPTDHHPGPVTTDIPGHREGRQKVRPLAMGDRRARRSGQLPRGHGPHPRRTPRAGWRRGRCRRRSDRRAGWCRPPVPHPEAVGVAVMAAITGSSSSVNASSRKTFRRSIAISTPVSRISRSTDRPASAGLDWPSRPPRRRRRGCRRDEGGHPSPPVPWRRVLGRAQPAVCFHG